MTQIEKERAKAYEKALEKARVLKECSTNKEVLRYIDDFFPELKESEDEKWIPKEIAKYLKEKGGFRSCWIAWLEKQGEGTDYANKEYWRGYNEGKQEILDKYAELEKQGEQKPADVRTTGYWLVEDTEQKPADKVEPKFHEGEWVVTDKNNVVQIKAIEDSKYVLENTMRFSVDYVDKCWRKWTIQDAKDGDVLVYEGEIFMIKSYALWDKIVYHCCYDGKNLHKHSIYASWKKEDFDKVHPATKEERALLFQKMKEVGYEWNAEKKELKKIENKNPLLSDFFKAEYERGKADAQKPYWSEEDERKLQLLIVMCDEAKGDSATYSTIYREMEELKTWLKTILQRKRSS